MGKDTETESTQQSAPWKAAQPYLKDMLSQAGELGDTPQTFFPGQTYAGMNPMQHQGLEMGQEYATSQLPGLINQSQGTWGDMLNAPDVANNPYVNAMIDQQASGLNRNLQENLLPSITDQYVGAGQLGSTRQGVAEGIALRGTQEALADATAKTQLGAYGQGLGQQANAMRMTPQMMQQGMMPGQIMGSIGSQYRGEEQLGINEAMQRHDFEQSEPWERLQREAGIVGGLSSPYGTQTSTQVQEGNMFKDLLGIGTTAAGMFMGNPGMIAGGLGTFGGAMGAGANPMDAYRATQVNPYTVTQNMW